MRVEPRVQPGPPPHPRPQVCTLRVRVSLLEHLLLGFECGSCREDHVSISYIHAVVNKET